MGAAHVENATDLACRTALSRRAVAHLTVPVDVQEHTLSRRDRSKRNVAGHTSQALSRGSPLPEAEDLEQAAEILNAGRKIVMMAGRGSIGAGDELEAIAERLGAVIVKPLLGKAAVPDDSPYTTGCIGLLGTKPSQAAIEDCDTLLIVGSSFPYIEFYPKPGQARGVQIDIDPERIGLAIPLRSDWWATACGRSGP
jgi:pyruvate dehydrogenase (quinone)/pyruvate oxidase